MGNVPNLPAVPLSSVFTSSQVSSGSPSSNWFQRTLDPQKVNMDYNAWQAQLNREFQRDMSNTAYQRAVADMRKAGLNPYALYSSANPASSPSGSVGSVGGAGNMAVLGQIAGIAISAFTLGARLKYYNTFSSSNGFSGWDNALKRAMEKDYLDGL